MSERVKPTGASLKVKVTCSVSPYEMSELTVVIRRVGAVVSVNQVMDVPELSSLSAKSLMPVELDFSVRR